MTQQERYQMQGSAPQIYEEQNVPSLFRPLAELTLRNVDVHEGDRVIDVACGTGILGRLVAEKLGRAGSVVGIDLNAGMIEVAQQHSPVTDASVEWRQGDASDLPFPDASFDIAFCQQGLQFFPDKLTALKELRRILAPGGFMILTVWSSVSLINAALSDALARYVSEEAAQSALAPFAFRDFQVINKLMIEAGIQEITTEILVVERRIGPAEQSVPGTIAGSPCADDVAKLDMATQDAIVNEVGEALREYRDENGFAVPQETHLIRATVL